MDCLSQLPAGLKLSNLRSKSSCNINGNNKNKEEDDLPPFYPEDRSSQASSDIVVDVGDDDDLNIPEGTATSKTVKKQTRFAKKNKNRVNSDSDDEENDYQNATRKSKDSQKNRPKKTVVKKDSKSKKTSKKRTLNEVTDIDETDDDFDIDVTGEVEEPVSDCAVEAVDSVASTTGPPVKTLSFGTMCKPETRDMATQTYESLLNRPIECEESQRIQKQVQFAEMYKPMYSIPKKKGGLPPLKVGLSLGGKKRKVYYPDEVVNGEAA